MITIYTDGSSRGNPGPGGWGAILFYEKNDQQLTTNNQQWVKELGGRDEHTTNNKMELTAAIKALESVGGTDITLFTDSEYVMKGMTEWIEGWQAKGWRTAAKKPVLNKELWQELLQVSDGKDVEWRYVAGHSGHEFNDRCDEIATTFADGLTPNLYDGAREEYQ